jgi:hypothetical protein
MSPARKTLTALWALRALSRTREAWEHSALQAALQAAVQAAVQTAADALALVPAIGRVRRRGHSAPRIEAPEAASQAPRGAVGPAWAAAE